MVHMDIKAHLSDSHVLIVRSSSLKIDKINPYSIRESQGPQWGRWRPQTEQRETKEPIGAFIASLDLTIDTLIITLQVGPCSPLLRGQV